MATPLADGGRRSGTQAPDHPSAALPRKWCRPTRWPFAGKNRCWAFCSSGRISTGMGDSGESTLPGSHRTRRKPKWSEDSVEEDEIALTETDLGRGAGGVRPFPHARCPHPLLPARRLPRVSTGLEGSPELEGWGPRSGDAEPVCGSAVPRPPDAMSYSRHSLPGNRRRQTYRIGVVRHRRGSGVRHHRLVTQGCDLEKVERDLGNPQFIGLKPYRTYSVSGDIAQCRIHEFLPTSRWSSPTSAAGGDDAPVQISRVRRPAQPRRSRGVRYQTLSQHPLAARPLLAHGERSGASTGS